MGAIYYLEDPFSLPKLRKRGVAGVSLFLGVFLQALLDGLMLEVSLNLCPLPQIMGGSGSLFGGIPLLHEASFKPGRGVSVILALVRRGV